MADHLPPAARPGRWRTGAEGAGTSSSLSSDNPFACDGPEDEQTHPIASDNLRRALAQEAARIMAEHGIRDFLIAKRKAAERLGVTDGARCCPRTSRSRARSPSISACLAANRMSQSLHAQRRAALNAMRLPAGFEPRLVGAVLSGTATEHSDVQLHLFADRAESVTIKLMDQGIPHEVTEKRVRMNAERRVGLSRSALRDRRAVHRGHGVSDGRHPSGAGEPGRWPADAAREHPSKLEAAAAAAVSSIESRRSRCDLLISTYSRRVGPVYSWRGRPMRIAGSEIISCQCATQPTVRAIANITVNIERGMPIAL